MPEKLLAASALDLKRNETKGSWTGKAREVKIRPLICCSVFAFFFIF